MKKELQQIIDKYKEFKDYLNDIDTSMLKKASRSELQEFVKEIRVTDTFRYISLEVDEIIEKKKTEEYPQLLRVHNYPEIKELDCISEDDKIVLDEYLLSLGFRCYIHKYSGAWRNIADKWSNEVEVKVFKFLVDKGIVELLYKLELCHMRLTLSKEKMDKCFRYFKLEDMAKTKEEWNEYYDLEAELELPSCCFECDEEISITKNVLIQVQNSPDCYLYKVVKERDKSLDNV